MTSARRASLWIMLCVGISMLWGTSYGRGPETVVDFTAVYYGAGCLLHHCDPYHPAALEQFYLDHEGRLPADPAELVRFRRGVMTCMNLPTALFLVLPLAVLPWKLAYWIWTCLVAALLVLASLAVWREAQIYAPRIALLLVCIVAVNAEILFGGGNTAGIAVSLCVLAVSYLLRERFVAVGVACLGIGLAVKPHDAALVWLFFLLAGRMNRRRALQSLLIAACIGLFAVAWVSHLAPHWITELQANLHSGVAPGGINEPGPQSITGTKANTVISLQAAIRVFSSNPSLCNAVSYLICGAMLIVWMARTVRIEGLHQNMWLAVAAVIAPTILITYHRIYDAKLLLLIIPACAMLWSRRRWAGWFALPVTIAAVVFTADIPLTVWALLRDRLMASAYTHSTKLTGVILWEPVPLILLLAAIFYLWVYLKSKSTLFVLSHESEANSRMGPSV